MTRAGYLCLLAGLTIALAGCGKQNKSAQRSVTPARDTPAVVAPPSIAAQEKSAAADTGKPAKVTRLNEDGSETVEESSADTGTRNTLLTAVAATVGAATSPASAAPLAGSAWVEGTNYTRLVPAQPTDVPAGQVEVLEFFWYACPHCYALESNVETWEKTKPAYVTFNRVHVMWSEGHRNIARLFYTLKALNKSEELSGEVFREIHVNGNSLLGSDPSNAAGAEQVQTAFAKKHGIAEDDFRKAYHSMPVDTAMQRADELVQRYRVSGVPEFIVNGKYIADVGSAGGPEKLMSLVGELATAEHKH